MSAPAPARTAAELAELGEEVAVLTRRLQKTAGLVEGHVERIATAIERILRDYGGASFRQYRNLVRDCDAVAAEIAKLTKEDAIWPKFAKILDLALLKIRKRDLYGGRQMVAKLARFRDPARDRGLMLGEYREGVKALEREVARLRTERDRLRSVRKPPISEADLERIKAVLEAADRGIQRAVVSELHEVPSRLALTAFAEGARDRRLVLPPVTDPEALPALMALLEGPGPVREHFGDRSVHSLLESLTFSDAKLAHLLGDGRPLKAALNPNLPWLKAITAPGALLPSLSLDLPLDGLRARTEALSIFAQRLHVAEEARERLGAVARALASGDVAKAQEADHLHRTFGDAARKAWEGTLEAGIEAIEKELAARTRDLQGLTPPDKLG